MVYHKRETFTKVTPKLVLMGFCMTVLYDISGDKGDIKTICCLSPCLVIDHGGCEAKHLERMKIREV